METEFEIVTGIQQVNSRTAISQPLLDTRLVKHYFSQYAEGYVWN